MSPKIRHIFLTGVTGVLGKEIVRYFLTRTPHHLYLLARAKGQLSAKGRIQKIFAEFSKDASFSQRVHVFDGDVTLSGLGLKDADRQFLKGKIEQIYHIAALTALNGSEEDCFRINLGGTEEVLKLAWMLRREGKLDRFFYFSTAFVAGSLQTFCAQEDSLPKNPAHANFYEASKYAAEKKVREALSLGLPVTIFRPSIVVGHSKTGEVSEFNVIYPFIKLFAHGILSKLPSRLENSFNIVPIDFVVEAAMAISEQETSLGKGYHLVTEEPPTLEMLLQVREEFYPKMANVELVDPEAFRSENLNGTEQLVFQMMKPYLGYLNDHLTFDTANTRKALEMTPIEMPKTDTAFLKTLLDYAVGSGYLLHQ